MENKSPDVDTPAVNVADLDRSAISSNVDLGPPRDEAHFDEPNHTVWYDESAYSGNSE